MLGGKVLHDLAAIDRNGHTRPMTWTDVDTYMSRNKRWRESTPHLGSALDFELDK